MRGLRYLAALLLAALLAACGQLATPATPEAGLSPQFTSLPGWSAAQGYQVEVLGRGLGAGRYPVPACDCVEGTITLANPETIEMIYVQVAVKGILDPVTTASPDLVSVTLGGETKTWTAAGPNTLTQNLVNPQGQPVDPREPGEVYEGVFAGPVAAASITARVEGVSTSGYYQPRAFIVYVFRKAGAEVSAGRTFNHYVFSDFGHPEATETVTVPASIAPRTLKATFAISDLQEASDGRPVVLTATAGAVTVTETIIPPDEDEVLVRTLTLLNVPGGVTEVVATVRSPFNEEYPPRGGDSVYWNGVNVSAPKPPPGNHGCTPGFWRNWTGKGPQPNAWAKTGYHPDQLFSSVFEDAFPGKTLHQVVSLNGGGLSALGRHTVAALLNAAHPDVAYGMSAAEVVAAFNAVYPGTDAAYETLKNRLEALNERGCPLNRRSY
jgi:hypothetical protein